LIGLDFLFGLGSVFGLLCSGVLLLLGLLTNMGKKDPYRNKVMERRVYGYFDKVTNKLLYIGSSRCSLEDLATNHIYAFERFPDDKRTYFRIALRSEITEGYFRNLVVKDCTLLEIEALEGILIRTFQPPYNEDMDPVKSSARNGRYN
jgi:hypothetical protein